MESKEEWWSGLPKWIQNESATHSGGHNTPEQHLKALQICPFTMLDCKTLIDKPTNQVCMTSGQNTLFSNQKYKMASTTVSKQKLPKANILMIPQDFLELDYFLYSFFTSFYKIF